MNFQIITNEKYNLLV